MRGPVMVLVVAVVAGCGHTESDYEYRIADLEAEKRLVVAEIYASRLEVQASIARAQAANPEAANTIAERRAKAFHESAEAAQKQIVALDKRIESLQGELYDAKCRRWISMRASDPENPNLEQIPPSTKVDASQTPTWKDLSASPEFRRLRVEDKEKVRQGYWREIVSPHVATENIEKARCLFDYRTTKQ